MADKRPAFQFYPMDYLSDENVVLMTLDQEGAYIRLLAHCWVEGSIPSDLPSLARLCRVQNGDMERIWPGLEKCFRKGGSRYRHPRLDLERRKQDAHRSAKSHAGRAGAKAKWEKAKDGSAIVLPMAKDGSSSSSSSSPSPSIPPTTTTTTTEEKTPAALPPLGGGNGTEIVCIGHPKSEAWNGAAVLSLFVDFCRSKQWPDPPRSQMGKLGAAAKRLAANDRGTVVRAMIGMDALFPHSDGQPWDLMDLEKKFTKANAAAQNHPEVQRAAFREAFLGDEK